jgi:hypothetical protein
MQQKSLVHRIIALLLATLMITTVHLPIPVAQALEAKKSKKIIELGRAKTKAAYTGVWKYPTLTKVV